MDEVTPFSSPSDSKTRPSSNRGNRHRPFFTPSLATASLGDGLCPVPGISASWSRSRSRCTTCLRDQESNSEGIVAATLSPEPLVSTPTDRFLGTPVFSRPSLLRVDLMVH